MAERSGMTDADIERRLKLVELATAQSIASNLQLINAVKALGLENIRPDLADAVTQSFGHLMKTFQELFETAAPEAAKVEEGHDA